MTSPSQPVNIRSPRLGPSDPTADNALSSSYRPSTTPDLRAIRAQYVGTPPQIPARGGTPLPRTGSPAISSGVLQESSPLARRPSFASSRRMGAGSVTPPVAGLDAPPQSLEGLSDEDKARVLRRHLVSKDDRQQRRVSASNSSDGQLGQQDISRRSSRSVLQRPGREETDPFPVPYDTHGADVTHDVYKWHADQRRQARPRALSYAGSEPPPDPAFEHIHEPGGFRRNYVLLRANEQGAEEPRILNNFIDFLFIFGHFAGEDLEEDEDDDSRDEDTEAGVDAASAPLLQDSTERTPLMARSKMRRSRSRHASVGPHGDATVTQAVLMLLKSFVGTGILFLGKAFSNGGVLFSAVTITLVALISLFSFLLLVKAKFVVSGSFGDIGGKLYGPWMRYAILSSIILSQIGFCAAYLIFVAENLQAFVMGVTHCLKLVPVQIFIALQLIFFIPMALIRDIAKLSGTALVADAFILAGLLYLFGSELSIIADRGIADVQLFNSKSYPLFIGTAVFSFEGIGLVIPITDSMREPHKFPKVLTGVMLFLSVLFGAGGALSYLTFGSDVKTVVIVNLDESKKMVQAVQFLYAMAILLSVPLQFFPAIRILENGIFTRSGKGNFRVKWQKNVFRFFLVLCTTAISWAGAADLDKFVSFIGSFACIPLCYIYPAMLHYRACATTRREKIIDFMMMGFGSIIAVYMTVQTLKLMFEPEPAGSPTFGACKRNNSDIVPPF